MNPTRAPWAEANAATSRSPSNAPSTLQTRQSIHTGKPIKPLIDAEPELPTVRPEAWPESWSPAQKRIKAQHDVEAALRGSSLRKFIAFTLSLNQSVVGVKLSHPCSMSPAVEAVMAGLNRLAAFIDDAPPVKHEVRYGNPAFRTWFQKLQEAAPELVLDMLGEDASGATIEILPYFLDSFGNRTRIDYGTGHETNFMMFLYCLFALGALKEDDQQATVLRVFKRYLDLIRQLQTTYWYGFTILSTKSDIFGLLLQIRG
jgi:serine/threonine-protein phosphatase 2A activator